MTFLTTSLLFWSIGAAVVTIPIIIHLLHRQRTQPVMWGAMMFLRLSVLQQKRRKRVEHWLLMLLRLLLLALLVFMLAQLVAKDVACLNKATATGAATDIAIVIDHSLSSGRKAEAGDRTVFEESIGTVAKLTDPAALRATDTVSIILAEKTPRAFTPLPVPKDRIGVEVTKLRNEKPGISSASIPQAVQEARRVLAKGPNPRKVVVVLHDGQQSGWQVKDKAAWESALGQRVKGVEPPVKLYDIQIAPDMKVPNLTLRDLSVFPPMVGPERPVSVEVTVVNNGTQPMPAKTQARLVVDGVDRPEVNEVTALPPGGTQTLQFTASFEKPGSHSFEIKLTAQDALAADNSAVGSCFVWERLPVLIIGERNHRPSPDKPAVPISADDDAALLKFALLSDAADVKSKALVEPTVISYKDLRLRALANPTPGSTTPEKNALRLEDYAVVILNNPGDIDPALRDKLADYVAKGGNGLWVILGPSGRDNAGERARILNWLNPGYASGSAPNPAGLFPVDVKADGPGGSPDAVSGTRVRAAGHPILSRFVDKNKRDLLAALTTERWWKLDVLKGSDVQTLLATEAGDPLVLERRVNGKGKVIVWTSPVDFESNWNSWNARGNVLAPLVNNTVQYLANNWYQPQPEKTPQLAVGTAFVWSSPELRYPERGGGTEPTFTLPDGRRVNQVASAEVIDPAGNKQAVEVRVIDRRQNIRFADTTLPGKYELRFPGRTDLSPIYFGVGPDAGELQAAPLNEDDKKWLSSDEHKFVEGSIAGTDLSKALGGGIERIDLWPWLAAGLVAFLLAETLMTTFLIRRQSGTGNVAGAIPGGVAPAAAA